MIILSLINVFLDSTWVVSDDSLMSKNVRTSVSESIRHNSGGKFNNRWSIAYLSITKQQQSQWWLWSYIIMITMMMNNLQHKNVYWFNVVLLLLFIISQVLLLILTRSSFVSWQLRLLHHLLSVSVVVGFLCVLFDTPVDICFDLDLNVIAYYIYGVITHKVRYSFSNLPFK